MSGIIEVEDLVKEYGKEVLAVRGINFDVKDGEIFGFLGPNGAGKSTTISIITTLLAPTSGKIRVNGFDVMKDATKVRGTIGLVPQNLTSDDELSGRENLYLQADLYNVPRDVAKERIDELLRIVKLEDAADRRVDTYSGGMRKRLELIEGLIHHPKVLFLDEPTLGLDIQTREIIWEYIQRIKAENNMTVFVTTHYLEEADSLCDRIAIIDDGEIKVIGTPDELKMSLGGDSIDVLIEDDEDRSEPLRNLANVIGVEKKEKEYRIRTTDGDATMSDVLAVAGNERWKIRSISLHRPSMNQVFLRYTGKSLRDSDSGSQKMNVRTAALQSMRRR